MITITLPCILGKKSKDELITSKDITIQLCENALIGRTNYWYKDGEDFKEKLINDKSYFKKAAIENIGIAWSNDDEVYFIAIKGVALDFYINVESAEKGNEVLDIFIKWWLE